MIIKLTVNDNDFSELLENFAKSLTNRLLGLVNTIPEDAPVDDKIQAHRDWDRTFKLLNPNVTTVTEQGDENEQFLCKQVIKCWTRFLRDRSDLDFEEKAYLLKDFDVSIHWIYMDKWENGEAVYYFTKSNVVINQ